MILTLHIAIALASIAQSSVAVVRPSRGKLHASYALIGATLASGTALVLLNPAHLGAACTSGLLYVGLMSVGVGATRLRLSRAAATID